MKRLITLLLCAVLASCCFNLALAASDVLSTDALQDSDKKAPSLRDSSSLLFARGYSEAVGDGKSLIYIDAAFQDNLIVWLETSDPHLVSYLEDLPAYLFFYLGKTVPLDKEQLKEKTAYGFLFIHAAIIDAVNDAYQKTLSGKPWRASEYRGMYDDAQARAADAQSRMDKLTIELADATTALEKARIVEDRIRFNLEAALEHISCKNCGYEFSEDEDFKFCPKCGAQR